MRGGPEPPRVIPAGGLAPFQPRTGIGLTPSTPLVGCNPCQTARLDISSCLRSHVSHMSVGVMDQGLEIRKNVSAAV
jgi:hypothetical protein